MSESGSMPLPRLTLVGKPAPANGADDAELARALIRQDPGITFVAWTRLHPAVDGTLRRLMGPGNDIPDIAQEVFLRFFRHVGKLRDPAALRSFLTGICLRVVRRELRSRWLRRFLHLTATGDAPELAASLDVESREVLQHYYALLERLGAEGRSLYVARHIERLPMAEVAAHHGLSISTTQRRLARVVRRMAAMVEGDPVLAAYVASAPEDEA
jgi:RNA polymerase sigma-70 factor (ECF subfamily)